MSFYFSIAWPVAPLLCGERWHSRDERPTCTHVRAAPATSAIAACGPSWRGCRAAHAAWTFISDSSAPFAQQGTLGGSYLLRGFGEGIKTYVEIGYPY